MNIPAIRRTIAPLAAFAAFAALAAGAALTDLPATIGTQLPLTGVDFGTKKPKVTLVPVGGGKTLPVKVLAGFTGTHLELVVNHVKLDQVGSHDLVIQPAGKGVAPITLSSYVSIGYPAIATFTPQAAPGGQVTIDGTLFGATKKGGFLKVGNKKAKIVSWSDTQIVAKLHKKTPLGVMPVWVHNKVGNVITTLIGMTIAN